MYRSAQMALANAIIALAADMPPPYDPRPAQCIYDAAISLVKDGDREGKDHGGF